MQERARGDSNQILGGQERKCSGRQKVQRMLYGEWAQAGSTFIFRH